jgi:hypothetical protein
VTRLNHYPSSPSLHVAQPQPTCPAICLWMTAPPGLLVFAPITNSTSPFALFHTLLLLLPLAAPSFAGPTAA